MSTGTVVIICVLIILAAGAVTIYNLLMNMRDEVRNAWSDVTVQLKRRADLIPSLVSTVNGYVSGEKKVFENLASVHFHSDMSSTSQGPEAAASAENFMQQALSSLFEVAEAYPKLRASAKFLELQAELADIENKIIVARRFYNGMVHKFNTRIKQFPSSIIASMFNITREEFFEVEDTGLLDILNKQELEGVVAHEISHIKNYDVRYKTIIMALAAIILELALLTRLVRILHGTRRG